MKNKFGVIAMILVCFTISSCKNNDYKKVYKFDDLQITKQTNCVFEFNNTSESQFYNVILMFRYAQGYQFNQAVFDFTFTPENGKTMTSILGLPVRNKKGEYVGEVSGDIWDIEQIVVEKRRLPLGKNTFTFKHAMPSDTIHNVMEIGLRIEKSK